MRLTFELLGWTWDWSLAPTSVEPEDEPQTQATKGDMLTTPVALARAEVPWEDAGSLHQFEAPEDRKLGFR